MKALLLSLFLTGSILVVAQPAQVQKQWGFRAMGTFAPAYIPSMKQAYYSFSGNWNFYLNEHVSVQGEGSWFIDNLGSTRSGLVSYHKLQAGFTYHFLKHRALDPFLGIHPGAGVLSYSDPNIMTLVAEPPRQEVVPMWSFGGGLNYYPGSILHFFIQMRYNGAVAHEVRQNALSLHEVQLALGIGLNFGIRRK